MGDVEDIVSLFDTSSNNYRDFSEKFASLPEDAVSKSFEEWYGYFLESHGDVFSDDNVEVIPQELYRLNLYFDLVLDAFLDAFSDTFGVVLENKQSGENNLTLSYTSPDFDDNGLKELKDLFKDQIIKKLEKEDYVRIQSDFARELYEGIVPRKMRQKLGEYYTPRGLAELSLNSLSDVGNQKILDPGCGSGIFLVTAIEQKIKEEKSVDEIFNEVQGMDINPIAVKASKLNYLIAIAQFLEERERIELPVFLNDALKLMHESKLQYRGTDLDEGYDTLVGNPPWIPWGRLTEEQREAWKSKYVSSLNLLPHEGIKKGLGHSNDDISVPFVWVTCYHYLDGQGEASFVLKRSILKGSSGTLFRSLRIKDTPLNVSKIFDFKGLKPFGKQVGAGTAIYTMEVGEEPEFPIPVSSFTQPEDGRPSFETQENLLQSLVQSKGSIDVLDHSDDAPWIRADLSKDCLGEFEHEIRHGLKDDAKDVFSVEESQVESLETDFIYPHIKSRHIVRWGFLGYDYHIVPQKKANEENEQELRKLAPKTYKHLEKHRKTLTEERSSRWLEKGPFYNVFGLGDYTWKKYKVAWCRLGFRPDFAVLEPVEDNLIGEKVVVPGDHYMFVPTNSKEEAFFIAGLLNSGPYQRTIKELGSEGKSGLPKSLIEKLKIPRYTGSDSMKEIADLSERAQRIVEHHLESTNTTSRRGYEDPEKLSDVQADLDRCVEELVESLGQSTLTSFS